MADTKIEWADKVWNSVIGCTKCSPGCLNCYAERFAYRLACMGQKKYQKVISTDGGVWNSEMFCDETVLNQPLDWHKPRRIFVCSMSDLFHPKVPFEFICKVMRVVEKCSQHTFLILTKRPQIAYDFFGGTSGAGLSAPPLPNLHLGVSISNQAEADEKIPILLQIPSAVRWLSIEPMLGPIDFVNGIKEPDGSDWWNGFLMDTNEGIASHLHWVVVGCESGPKRRPCKTEWIYSVIKQCRSAGIPCFVKQIDITGKVVKMPKGFPQELPERR